MIRETIAEALKSDALTIKDAAESIDTSPDDLADFCRTQQNKLVSMIDDVCDLLGLELVRTFTNDSWESYLEEAWANWGSKEPSLQYATSKSEEWAEESGGKLADGSITESYDKWSNLYDEKEFDAWEATALDEFEASERERLKKFAWVRWALHP